jgi:hypothetical protein
MKSVFILPLILSSSLAFALSVRSPCTEYWPESIEEGRIELTYSIDENCRAVDLDFEVSSPTGAFEQFAECHINRSVLVWDPQRASGTIHISEYESRLEEYRENNPSRYHQRSILARKSDGTQVGLFCYFNESWEPTEFGVMRDLDEREVKSDYFSTLPRQRFESDFTTWP